MAQPQSTPQSRPAESRAATTIREIFESGRPLTYIRSAEEQRIGRLLHEVAFGLGGSTPLPVWEWRLTEGLRKEDGPVEPGTLEPRAVLDFIVAHQDEAIFHLKDFHEPLRDSSEIRRRLRDVYDACLDRKSTRLNSSHLR